MMNLLNTLTTLNTLTKLTTLTTLLLLAAAPTPTLSQEEDAEPNCVAWASVGECNKNPKYMDEHCPIACENQAAVDREIAEANDKKVSHINSFFELEALDIDENLVQFEKFRGQVTVITNVASYCGYTRSHYFGMNQLYSKFKNASVGFNILAFPCNQFGEQEPETCPQIKKFAQSKQVEFTMMNKIDVNGINAHPVYVYLQKVAGPPRITWNFATYYVVTPDGVVASFTGVEPMELVPAIREAMDMEVEEGDLEGAVSDVEGEEEESSSEDESEDEEEEEEEKEL